MLNLIEITEPTHYNIQIFHILRTYRVASNLSILYVFQPHYFNDFLFCKTIREIIFVSQHQKGNFRQSFPTQKLFKIVLCYVNIFFISSVDDEYYAVRSCAIFLPTFSISPLASQIPELQSNVSFLYLSNTYPNGWDRVIQKVSCLKRIDQSGFPCLLQPHDREF